MFRVAYHTAPNSITLTDAMSLETAYMVFNTLIAEFDKVVLFNIETNETIATFEW